MRLLRRSMRPRTTCFHGFFAIVAIVAVATGVPVAAVAKVASLFDPKNIYSSSFYHANADRNWLAARTRYDCDVSARGCGKPAFVPSRASATARDGLRLCPPSGLRSHSWSIAPLTPPTDT